MSSRPTLKVAWVLILLILQTVSSLAQRDYVRISSQNKLQTAIGRFQDSKGARVDLVAVVHIGEPAYYQRLNRHFSNYQSVLYEMILDLPRSFAHQNDVRELLGKEKKEPKIDTSRGGRDPLSLVQKKMAAMLGLAFQQDHIDYTPDNFRHADLTLEEFREAMKMEEKSTEQVLESLYEGNEAQGIPGSEGLSSLSMLRILTVGPTEKEREYLKNQSALMLIHSTDPSQEIQGDVLIGRRNERAVQFLRERLEKGDKKVAIFYGAAHMPDLSNRLRKLGFKAMGRSWLDAWTLKDT